MNSATVVGALFAYLQRTPYYLALVVVDLVLGVARTQQQVVAHANLGQPRQQHHVNYHLGGAARHNIRCEEIKIFYSMIYTVFPVPLFNTLHTKLFHSDPIQYPSTQTEISDGARSYLFIFYSS
jgi:hypothetical protein